MADPSMSPDPVIPESLLNVDGWVTAEAAPMENVPDVTIYAQTSTKPGSRLPDGRYVLEGLRLVFLAGEDTPGGGTIVNVFEGPEMLTLTPFDLVMRVDHPEDAYNMIYGKKDASWITRFIDRKVNLYL